MRLCNLLELLDESHGCGRQCRASLCAFAWPGLDQADTQRPLAPAHIPPCVTVRPAVPPGRFRKRSVLRDVLQQLYPASTDGERPIDFEPYLGAYRDGR